MSRSPAPRTAAAVLSLGVLALAGCGGAAKDEPAAGPPPATGSSSASATASPTAGPAALTGIKDPKTGINGTQPAGPCSWVTAQQVGELASGSLGPEVVGSLNQAPLNGYQGTLRTCIFSLGGKGDSMSVGVMAFDSAADVAAFLKAADEEPGTSPVKDMPGATYTVFKSPMNVGQSLGVVDGSAIRFITARYAKDTATIVKNEPVANTDRLPALKAMYAKVFG